MERAPTRLARTTFPLSMTFGHYDFVRSASIREHYHRQEEVYEVIEGEIEVTTDGVARIANGIGSDRAALVYAIRSKLLATVELSSSTAP